MKKCHFCAEEIQDEAIKCRYCGEMLNDRQPSQGTSQPVMQAKGSHALWTFGVITFVCGLSIIGYYWQSFDVSVPGVNGERFYNIGLLAERQNGIVIGCVVTLIGFVCGLIDWVKSTPEERANWFTKLFEGPKYKKESLMVKKPANRKNPGIALILSLLMPGLGQFYNEQASKGFFFLIGFWVSVCAFLAGFYIPPATFYYYFPFEYSPAYAVLIGFLIGFFLWFFGFGDAFDQAKRINKYIDAKTLK